MPSHWGNHARSLFKPREKQVAADTGIRPSIALAGDVAQFGAIGPLAFTAVALASSCPPQGQLGLDLGLLMR